MSIVDTHGHRSKRNIYCMIVDGTINHSFYNPTEMSQIQNWANSQVQQKSFIIYYMNFKQWRIKRGRWCNHRSNGSVLNPIIDFLSQIVEDQFWIHPIDICLEYLKRRNLLPVHIWGPSEITEYIQEKWSDIRLINPPYKSVLIYYYSSMSEVEIQSIVTWLDRSTGNDIPILLIGWPTCMKAQLWSQYWSELDIYSTRFIYLDIGSYEFSQFVHSRAMSNDVIFITSEVMTTKILQRQLRQCISSYIHVDSWSVWLQNTHQLTNPCRQLIDVSSESDIVSTDGSMNKSFHICLIGSTDIAISLIKRWAHKQDLFITLWDISEERLNHSKNILNMDDKQSINNSYLHITSDVFKWIKTSHMWIMTSHTKHVTELWSIIVKRRSEIESSRFRLDEHRSDIPQSVSKIYVLSAVNGLMNGAMLVSQFLQYNLPPYCHQNVVTIHHDMIIHQNNSQSQPAWIFMSGGTVAIQTFLQKLFTMKNCSISFIPESWNIEWFWTYKNIITLMTGYIEDRLGNTISIKSLVLTQCLNESRWILHHISQLPDSVSVGYETNILPPIQEVDESEIIIESDLASGGKGENKNSTCERNLKVVDKTMEVKHEIIQQFSLGPLFGSLFTYQNNWIDLNIPELIYVSQIFLSVVTEPSNPEFKIGQWLSQGMNWKCIKKIYKNIANQVESIRCIDAIMTVVLNRFTNTDRQEFYQKCPLLNSVFKAIKGNIEPIPLSRVLLNKNMCHK